MFTNFRNIENNKEKVEWLGNRLLKSERDGFGFAVNGKSGVYGEKFIGKSQTYETTVFEKDKDQYSMTGLPFINVTRQPIGKFSKANGGAIFHGRTSTNKMGFKNTHPIQKHGWTLIHNGVVTDHGPKYKMITDNDTEHLVERLATGGIASLTQHLTGYYAFGAFDPSGNLHIGRDAIAWLYVAKLPELETYVFATTEDLIKEFCEEFTIDRSPIELVKNNVYMVFNTKGEMISCQNIESRGYDTYSRGLASKSLGYQNEYMENDSRSFAMSEYDDMAFEKRYSTMEMDLNSEDTDIDEKAIRDYDKYRTEVETSLDHSYVFQAPNGQTISLKEFKALEFEEQDRCTIIRPDGTWLTWKDFDDEKLPPNLY
jgi:predicted glutamine amidotransferase